MNALNTFYYGPQLFSGTKVIHCLTWSNTSAHCVWRIYLSDVTATCNSRFKTVVLYFILFSILYEWILLSVEKANIRELIAKSRQMSKASSDQEFTASSRNEWPARLTGQTKVSASHWCYHRRQKSAGAANSSTELLTEALPDHLPPSHSQQLHFYIVE